MLVADACIPPAIAREPDGRLKGYGLARSGSDATYIGPLVSSFPHSAMALLDQLLGSLTGHRIYVDVNTKFHGGPQPLSTRGLVKQRDLIRMSYGEQTDAASLASVFAIAGPELG